MIKERDEEKKINEVLHEIRYDEDHTHISYHMVDIIGLNLSNDIYSLNLAQVMYAAS